MTPLKLVHPLRASAPAPALPPGLSRRRFSERDAREVHALFSAAYVNGFGDVGAFEAWWPTLQADSEYDPALVILIVDENGSIVAAAQCWTSAFIKDFAVRADWRGRGVGEALVAAVLQAFAERGETSVTLKADPRNAPAIALYRRCGFVDAI